MIFFCVTTHGKSGTFLLARSEQNCDKEERRRRRFFVTSLTGARQMADEIRRRHHKQHRLHISLRTESYADCVRGQTRWHWDRDTLTGPDWTGLGRAGPDWAGLDAAQGAVTPYCTL